MVVISCNLTKVVVMIIVLYQIHRTHLVKTGDVISSFLQDPDPVTVGYATASERLMLDMSKAPVLRNGQQIRWQP